MFQILWEEPIITAAILGFWGVSLFIRILLGSLYRNMIKQSDNMATTNNRLLKQCKLKFANCYQLNSGVSNIPVFVDKFLNRLTLGPFSFETLYHLSGQSMLLSVIFSGVGICRSVMRGRTVGEILPFYMMSFLGLYLYFSVSSLVDLKGKKRVLKVNLVDYLENHLSARIGVTERDMKMLYGKKRTLEIVPIGTRGQMAAGAEFEEIISMPGGRDIVRTVEVPQTSSKEDVVEVPQVTEFPEGKTQSGKGIGSGARQDAGEQQGAEQSQGTEPQGEAAPVSPFYISEEELEALIKEFC